MDINKLIGSPSPELLEELAKEEVPTHAKAEDAAGIVKEALSALGDMYQAVEVKHGKGFRVCVEVAVMAATACSGLAIIREISQKNRVVLVSGLITVSTQTLDSIAKTMGCDINGEHRAEFKAWVDRAMALRLTFQKRLAVAMKGAE